MIRIGPGVLGLLALAAGCHGDDIRLVGDGDAGPLDADDARCPTAARLTECNPLAGVGMQGCPGGHKCAWQVLRDAPDRIGRVACVPDGIVERGGACTVGPPGETAGFDDCQAGNTCVGGTCLDLCGFGGGAAEACPVGETCVRVVDQWSNCGAPPLYGVCLPP